MRRLLLLAIAIMVAGIILVSCTNGGKIEKYIFKSGGVEIIPGEDSAAILGALGKESSYDEVDIGCGNNEVGKVYSYSGFKIQTYPDNSKDYVDTVTITNDSVSTPEGITIGSSRDDVIKAYGDGYTEKSNGIVYIKDKTTLSFVIRDGLVTSIIYDYNFD